MKRVWFSLIILMLMTANGFAQTSWEKYSGNPVLSGGSPGEWDSSGVIATGTIFDGTTYHIWYSTLDSLEGIGYATSSDGVNWTKHAANPVLEPGPEGAWDDISPGGPSVILVNSTYHMWYSVFDGINALIGYATSPDGFTWSKDASNPVIEPGPDGAWDDEGVLSSGVIYEDGIYHMWYDGWDGANTRIGLATSSDGFNWTKSAGNPVMDVGPAESWDDASIGFPSVVFDGTTYQMWYTGNDSMEVGTPFGAGIAGIGYATSPDGSIWTKFEENPILSTGPCCAAWDWIAAFLPNVVFDGSKYQMWYSGIGFIDGSVEFSIGYAVSLNPVITSISDVPEDQGGWVFLSWVASLLDSSGQITQYGVSEYDADEGWVSLGSVQAEQKSNYTYLAHTFGDSTADGGIFWSQFLVTAHTADPEVFYASAVNSGYSIDNLAPAVPTGLMASVAEGNAVQLTWAPPVDEDFKYFRIYRDVAADFDPTGTEPLAETIENALTDSDVQTEMTYYYRVSAVDFNGNESTVSEPVSAPVLAVGGHSGIPQAFTLSQNYPNPFNPVTSIRIELPEATDVVFVVYDIQGREVVRLGEGNYPAGYWNLVWNGHDEFGDEVPSGIYIARLLTPEYTKSIKMVLLK